MQKTYLGDSVYAEYDGYFLTLTTENGLGATNTIIFEPEVMSALDGYLSEIKEQIARNQEAEGFK